MSGAGQTYKDVLLKRVLRPASALIIAGAAAVAIWEWATDDSIRDVDDLYDVMVSVRTAMEGPEGIALTPEQQREFQSELSAIAEVAATTSGDADASSYLRIYSGLFELELGKGSDVELPNGDFASIAFSSASGASRIMANFDGKDVLISSGHKFEFPDHPTCSLVYMGRGDSASKPALFRFRCAQG